VRPLRPAVRAGAVVTRSAPVVIATPAATDRALRQTRAAGFPYAVVPLRADDEANREFPRANRVTGWDPDGYSVDLHVKGACCMGEWWPDGDAAMAVVMCLLDRDHAGPCGHITRDVWGLCAELLDEVMAR